MRDGQYAIEAGDEVLAPEMKRIMLKAVAIHKRREKLAETTMVKYRGDLKKQVERWLARSPTNKEGIRLKKRYEQIKDNLFLFLEDPEVPPTNNSSVQAVRMSKIFRKLTNCFRSEWGRDLFGLVRSVVNTGKRQGLSAYPSILRALDSSRSLFHPS